MSHILARFSPVRKSILVSFLHHAIASISELTSSAADRWSGSSFFSSSMTEGEKKEGNTHLVHIAYSGMHGIGL